MNLDKVLELSKRDAQSLNMEKSVVRFYHVI